jgi:hypothetical protein
MSDFSLSFKNFNMKSQKALNQVIRKTALELYGSIIVDSPVDTGRFRANNMISIDNEIGFTTLEAENNPLSEPEDSSIFMKRSVVFNSTPLGRYIFIQNNLVYAKDIEFGTFTTKSSTPKTTNGFSNQAKKGVYRVNIIRFNQFLEQAVKETKR